MDVELERVHQRLVDAKLAEDVFGAEDTVLPSEFQLELLKVEYEKLKPIVTPSDYTNPVDVEAAKEARSLLGHFYDEAQIRLSRGIYGLPDFGKPRPMSASKSFAIGQNKYWLGEKISDTDRTSIYRGYLERAGVHLGQVAIKVVKDREQNSSALREIRNLNILHQAHVAQWKHLPLIVDRFESGRKLGIIYRLVDGFSLTQVRGYHLHINGLSQKHMLWILDRMLSVLGFIHSQGLVHGAVNPDHIMVRPSDHNAYLVGWGNGIFAPAKTGEKIKVFDPSFVAPEVLAKKEIGPWSDIFALGKTLIWLIGGDPTTNELPRGVEPLIERFLKHLVEENHRSRPSDAWGLYGEQSAIKDSLWPRKFVPLEMG